MQGAMARSRELSPPWGGWMPSIEETGAFPWGLRSQEHQGKFFVPSFKETKGICCEECISEAWRCNSCALISCWKRL